MAEVPFMAEKDYLAELIKYVSWNKLFLAFNNKQELEEEGKPTKSLLCIPRRGNKVPSMPENGGVYLRVILSMASHQVQQEEVYDSSSKQDS